MDEGFWHGEPLWPQREGGWKACGVVLVGGVSFRESPGCSREELSQRRCPEDTLEGVSCFEWEVPER